ncbi:hypothetical protein J0M99_12700 [Listeria monocytogenes]|nr:hypothetical protein [Listeria monocytogenes]
MVKKYTFDNVKSVFKEAGRELISTEYIPMEMSRKLHQHISFMENDVRNARGLGSQQNFEVENEIKN